MLAGGAAGTDYTGLATLIGAFAAFIVAVWGAIRPRNTATTPTAETKASDTAFEVLTGTVNLLDAQMQALTKEVDACKQKHEDCEHDRDRDRTEIRRLQRLVEDFLVRMEHKGTGR